MNTELPKITTWSEAVEVWSQLPKNRTQFFMFKATFRKIWSNLDPNLTCNDCTRDTLAHALADMMAEHDDKVRAASIMVQALWHAATGASNENQIPKFSYNDLLRRSEEIQRERYLKKDNDDNEDIVSEPKDANVCTVVIEPEPAPAEEQLQEPTQEEKKKEPMDDVTNQPSHSIKSCNVIQIAPDSYQPVAEFYSMSEAEKATGIHNIDRAIKRRIKAGGFYWCVRGEETGFKPNQPKMGRPSTSKKKSVSTTPAPTSLMQGKKALDSKTVLSGISDQDLIDEMIRRGWHGDLQITMNIKL